MPGKRKKSLKFSWHSHNYSYWGLLEFSNQELVFSGYIFGLSSNLQITEPAQSNRAIRIKLGIGCELSRPK